LRIGLLGRLGLLGVLGLALLGPLPTAAQTHTACYPSNYTKLKNDGSGFPADFCPFTYLPWRVRLPPSPAHIDQHNTDILRRDYLPTSGSNIGNAGPRVSNGANYFITTSRKPVNFQDGASQNHPWYIASSSDPKVHVKCGPGQVSYGCGDLHQTNTTDPPYGNGAGVPDFRLPPWARLNAQASYGADHYLGIIQANGDYAEFGGCWQASSTTFIQTRDWQNGDVLTPPSQLQPGEQTSCNDILYGAIYGNIVTDPGTNTGVVNAGDPMVTLPVTYQELLVIHEIRHALHVYASCFCDCAGRYPGTYAGICTSASIPAGGGIPVGSHIYLNLTRAQIDDLSARKPTVIPPFLKLFAYALHEYGAHVLDTGSSGYKWISQFLIEPFDNALYSNAITVSPWQSWFLDTTHGGGEGAGAFAMGFIPEDVGLAANAFPWPNFIDWHDPEIIAAMYVLDECYVRGTCTNPNDNVPDPDSNPPTQPVTYYVAAGAPDNDCTAAKQSTTPRNTITKGLACLNVNGGDTLVIANGTYPEQLPDSIPSGTSSNLVTTVKAATPGGPLLRPTSLPSGATIVPVGTTQATGRSFITLQGLTIDGSLLPVGTRTIGLEVGSTSTGGARTGSHDILLDQIRVVDVPNNNAACGQSQPSMGIHVGQADWKITLQNVGLSNIGRGAIADPGTCAPDTMAYGVGIAFDGSDSLLTNLDITQTQAHALRFKGLSAGGANIVRIAYLHTTGAGVLLACGGQSSGSITNQLYDTIIASSGKFGQAPQAHSLVLGGACGGQTSTTTLVANSTIWNGKGSCVYVSGTSDGQASTNNTLRNILCYANETNAITLGTGATGNTVSNNLTTQDPLFVVSPPTPASPPTDFQVQVSPNKSPAIDMGIAVATATTSDYGGNLRPFPAGGAWDIGAWEAGPAPAVGGLVGQWPFDEGSGTTATDLTGIRPLTFPASTLTWTPGHVGPFALGCDGINAAQHPTPFTLAQHTVMFWWWPQAAPGTTGRQVIANGAGGTGSVLVWSFSWGHWDPVNRQAWTLYNGLNTWTVLQYPTTLAPQTWQHLTATYDGATYRAYLNGQPVLSKAGPGPGTPQGAFMVCSGGSGLAESGQVDDLKVWNRALTDAEIAQQYTGQGGRRRQHRVMAQ
jgi:hypothetical protein